MTLARLAQLAAVNTHFRPVLGNESKFLKLQSGMIVEEREQLFSLTRLFESHRMMGKIDGFN